VEATKQKEEKRKKPKAQGTGRHATATASALPSCSIHQKKNLTGKSSGGHQAKKRNPSGKKNVTRTLSYQFHSTRKAESMIS
jgi:predicted alpha/beta-hydrolase family hydrolase